MGGLNRGERRGRYPIWRGMGQTRPGSRPDDFVKSFTKSAVKKAGVLLRPFPAIFPKFGRVAPMGKVIPSRSAGDEVGFLSVGWNVGGGAFRQKLPRLMPT